MQRYVIRGWMVVAMVGTVCVAGCSKTKPRTPTYSPEGELIPIEDVEYGMAPRGPDGQRITDAEAMFESVLFGYNQYHIIPQEAAKIEQVAQYMRQYAGTHLVTEGHCDERGTREYNVALGEHRAQAVRAYLISLGVAGDRIQTRSFGEERPLDPGHNENAWRVNRRVEFALYR